VAGISIFTVTTFHRARGDGVPSLNRWYGRNLPEQGCFAGPVWCICPFAPVRLWTCVRHCNTSSTGRVSGPTSSCVCRGLCFLLNSWLNYFTLCPTSRVRFIPVAASICLVPSHGSPSFQIFICLCLFGFGAGQPSRVFSGGSFITWCYRVLFERICTHKKITTLTVFK